MPKNRISLLKKDYELLIPFIKEPWKKYSFKEIKKISKKTSESYVYGCLKKYVAENILNEEKAGNVTLYFANFSSYKTLNYLGFISENIAWSNDKLPFDVIKKIIANISTDYFTFIITGSYARNKQTDKSDLDVVIVCDDKIDTKHLLAQIHHVCEFSIPEAHPYIFRKSEFLEMLSNKQANYGKEIAKNNLLLCGGAQYFSIIREAMENGLNAEKLS